MTLPDDWFEEETGQGRVLNVEKVEAEIERLRTALERWVSMARSDVRYSEHRPEPRGHHPYDAPLKVSLEALAAGQESQ